MNDILNKQSNPLATKGFSSDIPASVNDDQDEPVSKPRQTNDLPVATNTERLVKTTVEVKESLHDRLKFASFKTRKSMKVIMDEALDKYLKEIGY